MAYRWVPIMGTVRTEGERIVFPGQQLGAKDDQTDVPDGQKKTLPMGLVICDQTFTGGTITASVQFSKLTPRTNCEVVLFYDPANRYNLNAGLTSERNALYTIRHFDSKWTYHAATGDGDSLEVNRTYKLAATLRGSVATLAVDGVDVLKSTLPFILPQSQVGLWFLGDGDITVSDYSIQNELPRAFVVMPFAEPYDTVHGEVIQKVCVQAGVDPIRGDERVGPGMILTDIIRDISDCNLLIVDITPTGEGKFNPNVFYELGYAHALNKRAILLARKGTTLPFDISAFRTVFYEDSIGGKSALENALRVHIEATLSADRRP